MYAINGYIDGNKIVTGENIADYEGHNVIITILDSVQAGILNLQNRSTSEHAKMAARSLSGLWSAHDSESVDEMVRSLRRGRSFDL